MVNEKNDNNVRTFEQATILKIQEANNTVDTDKRYAIINSIFVDFLTDIGKRILRIKMSTRETCVNMAIQARETQELAVNANALLDYINSICSD
tara:strand:- start:162 stop:443 length:282 start_codon:yes stop_codon:yes gene_type:complete